MPDLIIFDCDGTLTDSEELSNGALLTALHEEGFTQYDMPHARAHWLGTTVSDTLAAIARETGRTPPPGIVERYIALMRVKLATELVPIPGAALLVGAAAAHGRICVASNGERGNVIQSLRVTGLLPFFTEETVFTKEQVARPKPAPDLFLYAAAQMGVAPENCLVIEDSAAGVRAGLAAGMTVWAFTGSAHDPASHAAHLQEQGAQNIFARLEQMAELL